MIAASAAAPAALQPPAAAAEELREAVASFDAVDAALLERRALLRRADTKFLLRCEALAPVLGRLSRSHGVVLAGTERIATYETLYFDVPALRGYDDHVRGREPRHKVRTRRYPERGACYLEVKCKTNRGRSEKARRPHPYGEAALSEEETAWALGITRWPGGTLLPQAWTRFRRITLLGLEADERVTVDVGLRVERPPLTRCLHGFAIVEVKQARFDPRSPAMLALRRGGARVRSVSKYAVAMGLLAEGARRNRLLPTLREIERYDRWQS